MPKPPADPADPQQLVLYEWERSSIHPRVPPMVMSGSEMIGLAGRLTAALRIPQPTVRFTALNVACRATPSENLLEFAEWGRNAAVLAHEVSHLATWRHVLAGEAPHGPTFLAVAMQLYNRFLGFSMPYLMDGADNRDLDYDRALALSPLPAELTGSFFPTEL